MWRITVSLAVLLSLALAGCGNGRAAPTDARPGAPASLSYGTPPTALRVDPAPAEHAAVPRETALRAVQHPPVAPVGNRTLNYFGLARVTADSGVLSDGTGPRGYHGTLAWVGIYRQSGAGPHGCPALSRPPSNPPTKPWTYTFAVIVDAASGHTGTWSEDVSAHLLADCGITHR